MITAVCETYCMWFPRVRKI